VGDDHPGGNLFYFAACKTVGDDPKQLHRNQTYKTAEALNSEDGGHDQADRHRRALIRDVRIRHDLAPIGGAADRFHRRIVQSDPDHPYQIIEGIHRQQQKYRPISTDDEQAEVPQSHEPAEVPHEGLRPGVMLSLEHPGDNGKDYSGKKYHRGDIAQSEIAGTEVERKQIHDGLAHQAEGDAVEHFLAIHVLLADSFFFVA